MILLNAVINASQSLDARVALRRELLSEMDLMDLELGSLFQSLRKVCFGICGTNLCPFF